jgi:DNA-binding IclR family transcriptional regulator
MSSEGRGVQSIEVGGRILQALVEAEQPMMLRDLARQAGVLPAQAHAYLVSYRKQDLVEQDATAGRYRLGPFALQLGIARMRSFDPLRMAGDLLTDLVEATSLTVTLAIWGTHGPTVIQIQEGLDQLYTNTRAGTVYSVGGTATGRVFAAFMPERIVRAALEAETAEGVKSRRIGSKDPLSPKALRAAIAQVRRQGYATIDPPPVPGVGAVCAPVFDHVGQIQMAVTVIGPKQTMDVSASGAIVQKLLAFTNRMSVQLGYEAAPVPETVAADEERNFRKI